MTKIRETKTEQAGLGGLVMLTRIRTLAPGEETPPNVETVPANTPEHDWEVASNGS